MSRVAVVARWWGWCQPCATDRPLVLTSHGPHGTRAWLAGYGPEDRELSYCCELCGAVEPVPATQALDDVYDATLPRWPDLLLDPAPAPVPVAPVIEPVVAEAVVAALPLADVCAEVPGDVWQLAVRRLAGPVPATSPALATPPVPAAPLSGFVGVRASVVPVQRVDVTDLLDLLALSA